ncbi:hypothetical protein LJ751_04805 [Arthrobacter sp. zg-Y809]|uniref:DUF8175 domain-containing protein n=2 Tax=Arthrobacter gengyunqii TaxID=2886940 RepID=A0A9X1M0N4_9MICC|nr:hypothetical protein [Arthrobacter gengyunqii]
MTRSPDNAPENNPFTKPGFILSAVLVVTLMAAGVVYFLLPPKDDSAQSAPAPTTGSSSSSVTLSPSVSADDNNFERKSVCGLPLTDELTLDTAPTSNWELVDLMATPRDSLTFGPGITEESGFRSCFASSPAGALYAAMNVIALGSSGSPEVMMKTADQLFVPGTGRDAAIKDTSTAVDSSGTADIQVRGFVIRSYTPSEANMDLAFETTEGVLFRVTMSLRWMSDDWKVQPADDGTPWSGMSQISDLSGFVLWSGA